MDREHNHPFLHHRADADRRVHQAPAAQQESFVAVARRIPPHAWRGVSGHVLRQRRTFRRGAVTSLLLATVPTSGAAVGRGGFSPLLRYCRVRLDARQQFHIAAAGRSHSAHCRWRDFGLRPADAEPYRLARKLLHSDTARTCHWRVWQGPHLRGLHPRCRHRHTPGGVWNCLCHSQCDASRGRLAGRRPAEQRGSVNGHFLSWPPRFERPSGRGRLLCGLLGVGRQLSGCRRDRTCHQTRRRQLENSACTT